MEYIQKRNNWTDDTMKYIDWNLHRKAFNKKINQRVSYCKMIHDILPTNKMNHRYDPSTNIPNCPRCNYKLEYQDHVIRYQYSDGWFKASLLEWKTLMLEQNTDPILQTIFLQGITKWSQMQPFQTTEFPTEYRNLLDQQEQIGWRQIRSGRWSIQWKQLQNKHLQSLSQQEDKGKEWTQTLLASVWQSWDDLWSERNSIVHGNSPETRAEAFKTKIHQNLQRIYNQKHLYLPSDRQLLLSSYDLHAQHNTHTIANWIHAYDPVFKASIKKAQTKLVSNTKSIASYLSPSDIAKNCPKINPSTHIRKSSNNEPEKYSQRFKRESPLAYNPTILLSDADTETETETQITYHITNAYSTYQSHAGPQHNHHIHAYHFTLFQQNKRNKVTIFSGRTQCTRL